VRFRDASVRNHGKATTAVYVRCCWDGSSPVV
jgi:hypothetical protein